MRTNLRNDLNVEGIYLQDGKPIQAQSLVSVRSAEDLAGDLDSSVVYLIDGIIDMGSQSIAVPETGLSIDGLSRETSGLVSSETNYTMFVNPEGGYAGDLFMSDMFIQVDGANSQVFDLDNQENNGAVEMSNFNFNFCESLGVMTAYRQGFGTEFGVIGCKDGLEMDGTWSGGFAILTAILVSAGVPFTGTLLKAGASLLVNGSIRTDINALQIDAAGALCDFSPSNIANDDEFRITDVRVNASSTAFPNMPTSNTKARFSNCVGTPNTYVGGQWMCTASTTTSIPAVNTPVKIAGTTEYEDMQWFSNTTDNAFVYDGTGNVRVIVRSQIPLAGGVGDEINTILRQWDDSASAYIDLAESGPVTLSLFGSQASISLHGFASLDTNDRIEVWVENQSDASDVTMNTGGIVSVSERSS